MQVCRRNTGANRLPDAWGVQTAAAIIAIGTPPVLCLCFLQDPQARAAVGEMSYNELVTKLATLLGAATPKHLTSRPSSARAARTPPSRSQSKVCLVPWDSLVLQNLRTCTSWEKSFEHESTQGGLLALQELEIFSRNWCMSEILCNTARTPSSRSQSKVCIVP